MPTATNAQVREGSFRTTQWTQILEASADGNGDGKSAFGRLYTAYWRPLFFHVRRRGYSTAEAEDLTQEFFLRLLEKQSLAGIERVGGRFRSFLLQALDNFLANEWDRARAQKRGGGVRPLSLDLEQAEAHFAKEIVGSETPELLFEKRWAFTLIERVQNRLAEHYVKNRRQAVHRSLRGFLLTDSAGASYAEIARDLDMTEGAVKVAVHRMRKLFGEILREEISQTVDQPGLVDDELRYLIEIVGR